MDGSILLKSTSTPQPLGRADTAGRAESITLLVACPKSARLVRRC